MQEFIGMRKDARALWEEIASLAVELRASAGGKQESLSLPSPPVHMCCHQGRPAGSAAAAQSRVWRKTREGNTCSCSWAPFSAKPRRVGGGFAMCLVMLCVHAHFTDIAAVCAGFNIGGIEGKYLGKDYTRRRHINLSSWLNFVIFTNVKHIWSGIPFDLFTAFVSHICRGFPNTDISLIWPGFVFCTESPV